MIPSFIVGDIPVIIYSRESGQVEAQLGRISDGKLFRLITKTIEKKFDVQWLQQLDGLDQRYWDFKIKGEILTLHFEHYLGISLFPSKDTPSLETANSLVEAIGAYLDSTIMNGYD